MRSQHRGRTAEGSGPVVAEIHVASIVHHVVDLRGATGFAMRALGLTTAGIGPGHVIVQNRSICLRLVADPSADYLPDLDLELSVGDVEEAAASLLYLNGVSVEEMPRWATDTRREAVLRGPHRFRLILGHEFDEDELGVTPCLPVAMPWDAGAERLILSLLERLPVPFRGNARRRVAGWIETLAGRARARVVDSDLALHGFIQVTPKDDLPDLRRELLARGVDLSRYAEDFLRE